MRGATARPASGEEERATWLQDSIFSHVHTPTLPEDQSKQTLSVHGWQPQAMAHIRELAFMSSDHQDTENEKEVPQEGTYLMQRQDEQVAVRW